MDNRRQLFYNVMGTQFVSELLTFVVGRESDFVPAGVYNKAYGTRVDATKRDCMLLHDLGGFRRPFEHLIRLHAVSAGAAFGLGAGLVPIEFEFCAYGDGGAFTAHADTPANAARRLTCVYYFSRTPRPFTGGQLRLHPWPIPLTGASREMLDIEPECDSMVMFPSILPHEVLSVNSPTGSWSDRRFSLTCWLAASQLATSQQQSSAT
jgi:SM-20-related protein